MTPAELEELAAYIADLLRSARQAAMGGRDDEAAELYEQVAQLELGHDGYLE